MALSDNREKTPRVPPAGRNVMKLKKHKIILRLPTAPGKVRQEGQEVVFLWEQCDVNITVKFLEASGMYRTSKMHRPDARVIWGHLISKGYKIINVSKSMHWNTVQNIWEADDRND